MNPIRTLIVLVLFGAIAAATVVSTAYAEAQGDGEPATGVHWQSAGDSYSSGEGVPGNTGGCAQSAKAYGPSAARIQREQHDWEMASETFTACTGHLVEDFFNPRPGEMNPDGTEKTSLWQWSRDQGGPERVDVLTMSIGGNDIGFADYLRDCLFFLPDSWAVWTLPIEVPAVGSGCDTSEEDIEARGNALLDPTQSCTGGRHGSRIVPAESNRNYAFGYACDLMIDSARGRRGSIIDFYYDLVTQRLTRRGQLYIVGYPRLFAPVDDWDAWVKVACQGVKRGDAEKLGRLAEHLNTKLREAVDRANQAFGQTRVHYVDRLASFAAGHHELCGTGADWLNGIARDRGDGSKRKEMSFHPNAAGHADTAAGLAQLVTETLPPTAPMSDADLLALAACQGDCIVSGRIPIEHPRWGPIELVTFGPAANSGPVCADRFLIAVNAGGDVVWDPGVAGDLCPVYEFEPARPDGGPGAPVDGAGRIFMQFNPGRYAGTIVLTPTSAGFADHASLPILVDGQESGAYDTRFYNSVVADDDGDGIWEIKVDFAPCYNCADEPRFTFTYRWTGDDFTVDVPDGPVECGTVEVYAYNPDGSIWMSNTLNNVIADGVSCLDVHYRTDGYQGMPGIVEALVVADRDGGDRDTVSAAGFTCQVARETQLWAYACTGPDGAHLQFEEFVGGGA